MGLGSAARSPPGREAGWAAAGQAHAAVSVEKRRPSQVHQADTAWLLMQTERPESYIYEPKMGDPNDGWVGWVGDGIRDSLVILSGMKIALW